MARTVCATIERFPVAGVFNIARGAKRHVDVVRVRITENHHAADGEATPIYYHGETAESVAAQIAGVAGELAAGTTSAARERLPGLLPRGAARNALDSALWSLEARQTARPVWHLAGLEPPRPVMTAFTISLAEPAVMEAAARTAAARHGLLKLKLGGDGGDLDRITAVRRGAPDARLIVDANEAWGGRDIASEAAALVPFGVELIEQPVPAGSDHLLDGVHSPIPLCADESCQDRADLPRVIGRYQAINIKLDKCGGLTEALALAAEARQARLDLLTGCMLSTSLGIAPALLVAQQSRWVDLDGPLLLARDRTPGAHFGHGFIAPPPSGLWG